MDAPAPRAREVEWVPEPPSALTASASPRVGLRGAEAAVRAALHRCFWAQHGAPCPWQEASAGFAGAVLVLGLRL